MLALLNSWRYRKASKKQSDKLTLVISNMPGPEPTFKLTGRKVQSIIYVVGGMGDMTTGLSFLSINGKIKQSLISDVVHVPNPQELVDIFDKNFHQIL
mmetsp:Transcript_21313/g.20459  ORF Transcript_21313/g.20459 Transcript_21313/m.20459 type:complete len:98 (+) Transcript_21313:577-870(+)